VERKFREHGEANVSAEDGLIVIRSRGPWNIEHVHAGDAVICNLAREFGGKPWQVLGVLHGDGLHTPDAFEAQTEAIRQHHALGRRGTALVLVDVGGSAFFRSVFSRMYRAAGEAFEFFPDEQSARQWLAERSTHL